MCFKSRKISISTSKDIFVRFCKTISVLVIAFSCYNFLSRWPTTEAHLMRHFLSAYWGTNSENHTVEMVFTNDVFYCDQHHNISLNERHKYHNAHSAHLSTPGGPFHSRFECSASACLLRKVTKETRTERHSQRPTGMSLCQHDDQRPPSVKEIQMNLAKL
jgi:hypothetical protein